MDLIGNSAVTIRDYGTILHKRKLVLELTQRGFPTNRPPRWLALYGYLQKQYYSFQINLIFPPLAGTGRESIVERFICALCLRATNRTKPKNFYRAMRPVGRPDHALQWSGAICTRPTVIFLGGKTHCNFDCNT